ncbi:carboxypeptidase regulatory-like domain-containing protein [Fibrella aquatica]|uniref:carboxypeptidase regulatory-like domain-containing protein n=1 Tax=Fibrella aquatica TaxID=3242487 RepID=UPI003520D353
MKTLFTCLLLGLALATYAQNVPENRLTSASPTQTLRGTLVDAASRTPLPGVSVVLINSNPLVGTTTDGDGRFRLVNVPVGRVGLKITLVGYQELVLSDVLVNSGKETVLELPLTESLRQLAELAVTYKRAEDRTVANNELAVVSARPFNAAETNRYAGSLGDPSRMAANFAGVSGANDARNDIVVRGNSPASLLWRMEGVNIPNPNHFGALGTSGGPVSMLNANLLAKSDFLTGAFPAEYANALGSVFDLKLRKGNDEKREFLGQMAFNGLELGAEGPYSKKSDGMGGRSSYLVNYRYSLFGLLKNVGYQIAGTPEYQDGLFKTDLTVGSKGNLSVWVLGGQSRITFLGKDIDTDKPDAYGDENTNTRVNFSMGLGAVSYEHRFSNRTVGKLTLSGSRSTQHFEGDTVIYQSTGVIAQEIAAAKNDFTQEKLSLNAGLTHKLSAKDKLSGGVIVDLLHYDLQSRELYPSVVTLRNTDGQTGLFQAFGQWQHRFTDQLTLNTGMSVLHLALNGSTAVEPRAGLSYRVSPTSSLNVAYGLHSMMQPILTYFYQTRQANGSYALTNKDLGFTRSHHLVASYDRMLTPTLRLKLETYYQWLFNAPVERTPSYYSALTEGVSFAPTNKANLVNKGTGRNYGVELTLEQFFNRNYYFLVTASVFNSLYTGSDGVERNTPFNNRYVVNLLTGKEWQIGAKNNVLLVNWRMTTADGRFTTPINMAMSAETRSEVGDYNRAFSQQQSAYFRLDAKFGYRMNRTRSTHEFAIDLQNLTNHQNVFQQAYNPRTNQIGTAYQQGFLPVPYYRLTF